MQLSTTLEIDRDSAIVVVNVDGIFERYGSADPRERGWHLSTIDSYTEDLKHIELSERERCRAEEKLYNQLNEAGYD